MVKLTILFLAVVCMQATAAGQKETVTISGKDLSLEKVFSVIKKQTDYVCFYGYDVLKDARPVSLSFKNAEVSEVLKAALWGQGLDYSITGKTITIVKKVVAAALEESGKTIPVSGTVYNEAGQPLSGANVTIKTTGKGTITNAKGEFMLPAVPENSPLVISFIGYAPQVMKISEGKAMQVYLTVAKNELDKVVVQAYGTTTQRLATGNITTVTKEQIERHPVMNVLSAIEGQVPGLVVSPSNGYASGPFNVEIRGRSVIDAGLPQEPLYIIDGVPLTVLSMAGNDGYGQSSGFLQNGFGGPAYGQSPLFSINPNDIESISVLKDADATSIYGSRGANGVIIINTKKGKVGKTQLDASVYSGASVVTGRYKLLNTQQYLAMRREAFKNDGITPDDGNAYDLTTWDTARYTDWQKLMWGGTGHVIDAEFGLSGGDKQSTFRIGSGYHRQTSMFTQSGADQRASVQFNLSHRSINERLQLSLTSQYSYSQSDIVNIASSILLPPDAPSIFNPQGYINYEGWQPVSDQVNTFSAFFQPYTAKTNFMNSQFNLQYQLLKGLTFSSQFGYSTFHNSQMMIFPMMALNPITNPKGSSRFGNNNGYNAIVEPQIEYKQKIGKVTFDALAGASMQTVSQDGNTISGYGYVNDNLLHSVASAPIKDASDVNSKYHYNSVFGRININVQNRYILNLSMRRDGSSRFGPGKQFGNFGAVGAAWIFSENDWWKENLSFISFGKLRASYGTTGSDLIGDYKYLSLWGASNTLPYQGVPAYIPQGFANPDLQWEVNKKLEAAVNIGVLKDRIILELAVYRNRVGNQLIYSQLPAFTGFSGIQMNQDATVQNSGIEGTIRAKIIEKKDFQWSMDFNIGKNNNKLIAFPGLEKSPYASVYTIGQSLNIRRSLHSLGVDPSTGEYTYTDRNHDGVINTNSNDTANDLYNKDFSVKFNGGFSSSFSYKGLQLDVFFIFRKQVLSNSAYAQTPGTIGPSSNQLVDILNRWQKAGDVAKYARFTTQPVASDYYYGLSDGTYSDGSYIRLRNISLTYSFPDKLFRNSGFNKVKLYARGENLFVITKYAGIDPEATTLGALPPSKTFTMGLQFSF